MIDLDVDHVGSVLVSDKNYKDERLKSTVRLVQSCGRKSSLIPLFGQPDNIARAVDYYGPDIIHFCDALSGLNGDKRALTRIIESQIFIREKFPGLQIMRSIPIGRRGAAGWVPSLELADLFEPVSDWFLTDTLLVENHTPSDDDQPVAGFIGITGKTCDWDVAAALVRKSSIPVILAGGIGPENVVDGIARVKPAGVDSCTLTNMMDREGKAIRFRKDPDSVRAMVQAVRGAGSSHHPNR